MPFGVSCGIPNVIIHAKFHVDRLRGFWTAGPPKSAISYTYWNDPYNSPALPCRLWWLLTRHITGHYSKRFKEMYASSKRLKLHEELGDARITQDQQDVKSIKDYITDQCQNPFDTEEVPPELVNITSNNRPDCFKGGWGVHEACSWEGEGNCGEVPTEDAFEQHVLQAQYQVQIWNQNLKWQVLWAMGGAYQNRESFIQYYTKESAPAEVRVYITHFYRSDKTCTGQKCPCVVAGLSCIDICSCADECQNLNKPAESEGEVSTDL